MLPAMMAPNRREYQRIVWRKQLDEPFRLNQLAIVAYRTALVHSKRSVHCSIAPMATAATEVQ